MAISPVGGVQPPQYVQHAQSVRQEDEPHAKPEVKEKEPPPREERHDREKKKHAVDIRV